MNVHNDVFENKWEQICANDSLPWWATMKNKSLYRGLSYFFRQRIHRTNQNNMLEFVRLDSELERSNGMLENILRWEDDGGQMIGYGNPVDRLILYIAQELANER